MAPQKTVLITGATGYLGRAIAQHFARAGWTTYGVTRSASSASSLIKDEIIPLITSLSCPETYQPLLENLTFDVLISTVEVFSDYASHFSAWMEFFKCAAATSLTVTGKKPLLLFTSGNKDYGEAGLYGAADFKWVEEDSPLNPPATLAARAKNAIRIFDYSDYFHAALVRPCMVYGRSSSYYAYFLGQAATAETIVVRGEKGVVWHGVHVDGVADAYYLLATRLKPEEAHGQVYTVSNDRYETFGELAEGVAAAYGGRKIEWRERSEEEMWRLVPFSQALRSERLRTQTGWRPRHRGFLEGIEVYKAAFDEALRSKDPGVVKVMGMYGMEVPESF